MVLHYFLKKYGTAERLLLDTIFSLICCLCMMHLSRLCHMIISFSKNKSQKLRKGQKKKNSRWRELFATQNLFPTVSISNTIAFKTVHLSKEFIRQSKSRGWQKRKSFFLKNMKDMIWKIKCFMKQGSIHTLLAGFIIRWLKLEKWPIWMWKRSSTEKSTSTDHTFTSILKAHMTEFACT